MAANGVEACQDKTGAVIKYEQLNLVVKFGDWSHVRLEKAQTMLAIRRAFANGEIPLPEVFRWRKLNDKNFIHMSLVSGDTFREVCTLLISEGSIHIHHGTVLDIILFKDDYEEGPFTNIRSINDFVFAAATGIQLVPEGTTGFYREFLSDTGYIYVTHGDLTLGNIIISGEPNSRRIGDIIDWEQADWYPEYWDYCKSLYAVEHTHEWRSDGWADKAMQPYEVDWLAFAVLVVAASTKAIYILTNMLNNHLP
ncbi:hypothetical protein BKA67DRAFT_539855 [Truncatella angustata]|uniref:Aminoglycoside phosphotransferase domain-containing protein n=1 Tax=Truncatella angustata TaxID=152316 RepID=A0A9P8UDP8_9PEZI|nr:uncharacterized protein BKA67DRAFT_539855 [Truncatella angustata]KAH6648028.1 hypothetical protein BKA67DRAFT_539855 [Truncatella angustata]